MPKIRRLSLAAAGLPLLVGATAHAQGPTRAWEVLCTAQETPVRGCVRKSGKYVAFCIPEAQNLTPTTDRKGPLSAVPPVAYMQYRFGRADAVELRYPAALEGSARRFRYSWDLFARGYGHGHAITHGITVWLDGQVKAFLPCIDHTP